MVRHHMKKKKGGNAPSEKKRRAEKEAELENLDRFAGSSEEESADDEKDGERIECLRGDDGESSGEDPSDDDEDGEDAIAKEENEKDATRERDADSKRAEGKRLSQTEQSTESSEEESGESSSDDDYKDDEYAIDHAHPREDASKSNGMADAMTRILGGVSALEPSSSKSKTPNTNNPIVLSKTTTPLQRLQQKIQSEERALRQKRKDRRSENLTAMRLPLAPAGGTSEKSTKRGTSERRRGAADALAVAREIEAERTHRRIATRGVVALFNAISKHRQAVAEEEKAKEEEKARIREEGRASVRRKKEEEGKGGASRTTKHGFLDMIKSAASAGGGAGGDSKETSVGGGTVDGAKGREKGDGKREKSVGWSALKDDFMMNSKLKDWDKELSDDDEDDDEEEQNEKSAPARKRVKS
ncbi:hypothetical protein ACHAW6_005481 [Cyclotella cf. meneghiniana]